MIRYRPSFLQALAMLLLALLGSRATAQLSARPAYLQKRSDTEDLSSGATFKFDIASHLPPFTFRVIPEPHETDQYGNAESTVRAIEVFRGHSSQPLQRLTGCELSDMEPPPATTTDPPWFHTEDINFDGYQDVFLLTNWGATGNQGGCVWLFNRSTRRFEYSKEFSELQRHWLDTATKTIVTYGGGGMAGGIHIAERYKVYNNLPVLIYSESQDWDPAKNQFHCIVQERRGNKMTTVFDDTDEEAIKECDGSKVPIPRP